MKKYLILSVSVLSVIVLTIGLYLFFQGNNSLNKGIYFRKTFGYIGFVNENISLDFNYFSIKEELVNNDHSNFSLVTVENNEIEVDSYSIKTTKTEKLYTENVINIRINEENGHYTFCKLRLYSGNNYVDYNIGNVQVVSISTNLQVPKFLEMSYNQSFINDEFDISIRNISSSDINIVEVKMNNDVYINENPKNIILKSNEIYNYAIKLHTDKISKYDIIKVRPIIEFNCDSDTNLYIRTIAFTAEKIESLKVTEIYEFINTK